MGLFSTQDIYLEIGDLELTEHSLSVSEAKKLCGYWENPRYREQFLSDAEGANAEKVFSLFRSYASAKPSEAKDVLEPLAASRKITSSLVKYVVQSTDPALEKLQIESLAYHVIYFADRFDLEVEQIGTILNVYKNVLTDVAEAAKKNSNKVKKSLLKHRFFRWLFKVFGVELPPDLTSAELDTYNTTQVAGFEEVKVSKSEEEREELEESKSHESVEKLQVSVVNTEDLLKATTESVEFPPNPFLKISDEDIGLDTNLVDGRAAESLKELDLSLTDAREFLQRTIGESEDKKESVEKVNVGDVSEHSNAPQTLNTSLAKTDVLLTAMVGGKELPPNPFLDLKDEDIGLDTSREDGRAANKLNLSKRVSGDSSQITVVNEGGDLLRGDGEGEDEDIGSVDLSFLEAVTKARLDEDAGDLASPFGEFEGFEPIEKWGGEDFYSTGSDEVVEVVEKQEEDQKVDDAAGRGVLEKTNSHSSVLPFLGGSGTQSISVEDDEGEESLDEQEINQDSFNQEEIPLWKQQFSGTPPLSEEDKVLAHKIDYGDRSPSFTDSGEDEDVSLGNIFG